jgi:hypothetical protein
LKERLTFSLGRQVRTPLLTPALVIIDVPGVVLTAVDAQLVMVQAAALRNVEDIWKHQPITP